MGRKRFVVPEIVRLPLSDGDWIEVKKRLTIGEQRMVMSSFVGAYRTDGSRIPNLQTLGMGQVMAYLVDWSFRGADDKPVEVTQDSIKALDPDTYMEIDRAIEAHIEAVEAAAADAEKKIPVADAVSSSPTS